MPSRVVIPRHAGDGVDQLAALMLMSRHEGARRIVLRQGRDWIAASGANPCSRVRSSLGRNAIHIGILSLCSRGHNARIVTSHLRSVSGGLLALAALAATPARQMPVRVTIDAGIVEGARDPSHSDVVAFKGIPYAAPPVGASRWTTAPAADAVDRHPLRSRARARVSAVRSAAAGHEAARDGPGRRSVHRQAARCDERGLSVAQRVDVARRDGVEAAGDGLAARRRLGVRQRVRRGGRARAGRGGRRHR